MFCVCIHSWDRGGGGGEGEDGYNCSKLRACLLRSRCFWRHLPTVRVVRSLSLGTSNNSFFVARHDLLVGWCATFFFLIWQEHLSDGVSVNFQQLSCYLAARFFFFFWSKAALQQSNLSLVRCISFCPLWYCCSATSQQPARYQAKLLLEFCSIFFLLGGQSMVLRSAPKIAEVWRMDAQRYEEEVSVRRFCCCCADFAPKPLRSISPRYCCYTCTHRFFFDNGDKRHGCCCSEGFVPLLFTSSYDKRFPSGEKVWRIVFSAKPRT